MKKPKNNILLIIVSFLMCSLAVAAIYISTKEYFNLWPSEPVAQGSFPSTPKWIFYADNSIISSPAAKDQTVFVKTSTTLYALNVVENKVEWKVSSSTKRDLAYPPVVVGSLVIVVEDGSTLAAYSIESGELIWKTPALQIVETGTDPIQSIAFNNQYLYVARHDWDLTAYDLKTGKVIWKHDLPGRSGPYVVSNEKYVFFTAGEDTASILDANTGLDVWNYDKSGYFGPILLSNNTLYIADVIHASLISLDIDSQRINWIKNLPISTYEFSCMLEAEDNLLVAAQKLVMVSKQDGTILWTTDNLGYLECPVLLKDEIYIRNNQTDLYLLDKGSGRKQGKLQVRTNTVMKHDFFRSPIIANGFLVVPFGDNRLLVYQP
jgi:outer membrane protein assembly factor BamB